MNHNPYLSHIQNTLPRLLALFDCDRSSLSYGMGDRYYWAWGLIDFGNATFQGAVHGLALLWKNGLWPYTTHRDVFLKRADSLFQGADRLTRKDGSLEEAFPREGSFCVTALVSFDLLCAIDLLKNEIDARTKTRWLAVVQPMIGFLVKSDETHGLISNHLATAVAALVRWQALTGDVQAEEKAKTLLHRILKHQSDEGWFTEYEGADPGYQSLCTYYLTDVHRQRPDWNLLVPLQKSIEFLWHFAHPDGSFGGIYGSRCTRFYNPAGIETLAHEAPEALALADYMAQSIEQNKVVTLSSIDEPNLVPWFSAYCLAAVLYEQRKEVKFKPGLVPCQQKEKKRRWLPHAGLLIDQGLNHYTIVSTHKGGITVHFQNNILVENNVGVVVNNSHGILASTQSYATENPVEWQDDFTLKIQSGFCPMPKRQPRPIEFLALRLMCVSVFRNRFLREMVKRLLVKLLITTKKGLHGKNTRTVKLGPDLTIQDRTELPPGYEIMENPGPFVAIHMASQGYWQVQDEEPTQ